MKDALVNIPSGFNFEQDEHIIEQVTKAFAQCENEKTSYLKQVSDWRNCHVSEPQATDEEWLNNFSQPQLAEHSCYVDQPPETDREWLMDIPESQLAEAGMLFKKLEVYVTCQASQRDQKDTIKLLKEAAARSSQDGDTNGLDLAHTFDALSECAKHIQTAGATVTSTWYNLEGGVKRLVRDFQSAQTKGDLTKMIYLSVLGPDVAGESSPIKHT